jgi:hypothetical protein
MTAKDDQPDVGFGFNVPAKIAERLTELQDAVRNAPHHRPSKRVMVSALIHCAEMDGKSLERDVLGPFRLAYPDESRE